MRQPFAARIRLLLYVATSILLITCTTAAWAIPHSIVGQAAPDAKPAAATTAPQPVRDNPCDVILGAARNYCAQAPRKDAAPVTRAVSSGSIAHEQAPWLLLFSTLAVAAAIGLVVTTGRTSR